MMKTLRGGLWMVPGWLAAAAIVVALATCVGACGSSGSGPSDSFLNDAGLPADAVVITDPEGDVRDVDGTEPPADSQSADIVRAGLYLTDADLTLAVEHAALLPSSLAQIDYAAGTGEWLRWTLFIADQEGSIIYMPQFGLEGTDRSAYVYDKQTGESTELEVEPVISGSIVSYVFPRALLPELATPFRWGVGVEWQWWGSQQDADRFRFGDQATQDDSEGWSGYPYQWADYSG